MTAGSAEEAGTATAAGRAGAATTQVLRAGAGGLTAWTAAQITGGVELNGPAGRQAAVALVFLVLSQLPIRAGRLAKRLLRRVRWSEGAAAAVSCIAALGMLIGAVTLGPVQWWLTEVLCDHLGLPLHISGFWPFVVAPLVDLLLSVALAMPGACLTRKGRATGSVGRFTRLVACFGALWLLTSGLGIGRLGADEWWRSTATMAALAVLLLALAGLGATVYSDFGWPHLRSLLLAGLPFVAAFGVCAIALTLWLLSWLSTAMRPTLGIEGFGTFLWAGLITTAVLWAANLPSFLHGLRRRRHNSPTGDGGYGPARPPAVWANGFGYVWMTADETAGRS
ncbi:hypothetical protein [Kitasatospora sp. NPDC087315]|uniref:hypothetical protein n=1 Tax=Kitasatospora sp. NPDC087315 TaxID=3364069 RepID=UPI00381D7B3F